MCLLSLKIMCILPMQYVCRCILATPFQEIYDQCLVYIKCHSALYVSEYEFKFQVIYQNSYSMLGDNRHILPMNIHSGLIMGIALLLCGRQNLKIHCAGRYGDYILVKKMTFKKLIQYRQNKNTRGQMFKVVRKHYKWRDQETFIK